MFDELDENRNLKSYLKNSIYNNLPDNPDLEKYLKISYNFYFECDILERRSILELLYTEKSSIEFKNTINYLI